LTSTAESRPSPPSPTETTFQPSAERWFSTPDMEEASAVSTAYSGGSTVSSSPRSNRFLKWL
jgi:hypothetical protein